MAESNFTHLVGYARVSTKEQETLLQIDALRAAGVDRILQEKCSSVGLRPELRKLLGGLQPGDVLVVYKMDRIARSLKDLLSIIETVQQAGASIRSLTEPLDTTGPIGIFIVQVLGAVAQLERSIIRERVIAGQVAAITRGKKHGRPQLLSDEQESRIIQGWNAGTKKAVLARDLGVGWSVVDRVIRLHVNPRDPKYGPRRPVLDLYMPTHQEASYAAAA